MKYHGMVFAILGFSAVALGAFAAHGLRDRLDAHHMEIFRTGVTYHFYHALALGLTLVLPTVADPRPLAWAGVFFIVGTALFSGSLYALALTGISALGIVTPFGGLSFLIGWACLAWHFLGR
jgi:uncharacterized membrane protein YgdD (TMEM256/DUF423 family)